MIFSGIIACASTEVSAVFLVLRGTNFTRKLPPLDLEVLSRGIIRLGGQWRTALTRDVTHLFALHNQSDRVCAMFHLCVHR